MLGRGSRFSWVRRFDSGTRQFLTATESALVVHRWPTSPTHGEMTELLARAVATTQMGAEIDNHGRIDLDDRPASRAGFDHQYWRIQFDGQPPHLAYWDGRLTHGLTSVGPSDDDDAEFDELVPVLPAWWLRLHDLVGPLERMQQIA